MADKYTPQQLETIAQLSQEGKLDEVIEIVKQSLIENNLLVIALEDESSVPKVFYKGEEIKHKRNVFFDWDTETAVDMGGLSYAIEHAETNKECPVNNRIERKVKGHAFD